MVVWRDTLTKKPSHLTDIDNNKSFVVEQLSTLRPSRFDTPEDAKEREERVNKYTEQKFCDTSHCPDSKTPLDAGKQTLFVNAAIKGDEDMPIQLPWLVELRLPRADVRSEAGESGTEGADMTKVGKKRAVEVDQFDVEKRGSKRRRT